MSYQWIMANNKKRIQGIIKKQNISLKIGSMIVTNPYYISHQFNAFIIENVDRLLNKNKDSKFL
jgi:hypothetical protein